MPYRSTRIAPDAGPAGVEPEAEQDLDERTFGGDAGKEDERSAEQESEPPSRPAPEAEADRDLASIRHAIAQMETLSREQRRFLAGYAYILVRIARADGDINDAEILSMERSVSAAGSLPEAQGALLVALARRMNSLYGTTEDYATTREFARTSSPQERQRLMRACVSVGAADGFISGAEATELYEIGRELSFSVEDIDAIRDQVEPPEPDPSGDRTREE